MVYSERWDVPECKDFCNFICQLQSHACAFWLYVLLFCRLPTQSLLCFSILNSCPVIWSLWLGLCSTFYPCSGHCMCKCYPDILAERKQHKLFAKEERLGCSQPTSWVSFTFPQMPAKKSQEKTNDNKTTETRPMSPMDIDAIIPCRYQQAESGNTKKW